MFRSFVSVTALLATLDTASAADLFQSDPATLLRTETFTAEAFVGHLTSRAGEYVYNVYGSGQKVSQLDWKGDGTVVGARLAYSPFDWLTLRVRGWTLVASDGHLTDLDWLAGYFGRSSWTHISDSPDTRAKAWQGDVSVAVPLMGDDGLNLFAIGGYRYQKQEYEARGGSYIYSSSRLRDTVGTLPNDRLGIGYQQIWHTPYVGLGLTGQTESWSGTVEVIGSPFVAAEDKDYHALRSLVFTEKFPIGSMLGASASLEYRFSPTLTLTGRVDYQNYFETKGGTRIQDLATGLVSSYRKPAAGADYESTLLSIGAKVRL